MRRLLLSALVSFTPVMAVAQDSTPGLFADYATFESVVTSAMARGAIVDLLGAITDLSQLTISQRAQLDQEMAANWPTGFASSAVMVDEKLGDFSREIRAFWNEDAKYGYFYAYLHHLPTGEIQVMHFGLNRDITETFKLF